MLVDSHCHLHDSAFAADLEPVLQRARAAGVTAMLTIGTSLAESRAAVALAAAHPEIWATVGVAPHDEQPFSDESLAALRALAAQPRVVAIGECGLDYHYDTLPRAVLRDVFKRQLALAAELGMPLVIHNRDADADMLAMLREFAAQRPAAGADAERGSPPVCRSAAAPPRSDGVQPAESRLPERALGVMHCFSGDAALATELAALGFRISLAGPLTYSKPRALPDVARALPLAALLIETDAPYLAPQGYRGKRNEPAYVRAVAQKLADLRGETLVAIAQATAHNAAALFGLGALRAA